MPQDDSEKKYYKETGTKRERERGGWGGGKSDTGNLSWCREEGLGWWSSRTRSGPGTLKYGVYDVFRRPDRRNKMEVSDENPV